MVPCPAASGPGNHRRSRVEGRFIENEKTMLFALFLLSISVSVWTIRFFFYLASIRLLYHLPSYFVSFRILILPFLFRSFFSPYNTLRSKCIWASFFRFFFHVNESFNLFLSSCGIDRLSAPVAGNTRSDSSRSCQDVTQRFEIDRRRVKPIVMDHGDL